MPRYQSYVYMTTNKSNRVIYTGVTSDLIKRIYEHKEKLVDGFTKKYCATKLIYYEISDSIESAIARERQIKGWVRQKKVNLITSANPEWKDLYSELI